MTTDYLKFVQWSKEDQLFIGYCPDLFVGGICHGKDELTVYAELCSLVGEEIAATTLSQKALPKRTAQVMMPAVD